MIIFSKSLATSEVHPTGLVESHDSIGPASKKHGKGCVGAKGPIS
jgi:hypothetical protein